jgi:hypothetical protein
VRRLFRMMGAGNKVGEFAVRTSEEDGHERAVNIRAVSFEAAPTGMS